MEGVDLITNKSKLENQKLETLDLDHCYELYPSRHI